MICDGCGKRQGGLRYATSGRWAETWICRECWGTQIVDVRFGLEAEWKDFETRNPRFLHLQSELQEIMGAVVSRRFETTKPSDKVIFFLGRLAVEDYVEILLNAGNGYGVAALKLLRPMAERVITIMYLIRHPDRVDDFLAFDHVHQRRTIMHPTTAGIDLRKYFSGDRLAEIEARYQDVKDRFADRASWSELDLASMAHAVGLGRQYAGLVFMPTLQLHTTVQALMTRMEVTDEGPAFKPESQRVLADDALRGAHLCLSCLLVEHANHFGLAVDTTRIVRIYQACWPAKSEDC